ncbi:hypothetical protein GDO78_020463, partial [Eleutherodactylus coqui]
SDDSEDGLDETPHLTESEDPSMQVKEEPISPLLGDISREGISGVYPVSSHNGILQSELKSERGSLYNFSKLKKNRKWLRVG